MGNDNSPENFAKQKRSVIVAPAGYGKTELIAQSIACSEGRQLILTHTHAGIDSLRKRIKRYKIPSSCYSIDTIHSFALRFAGSYPETAGLTIQKPQKNEDYSQIISSAVQIFDTKLGKDILKCSYSGIFVDEYQDCEINQHRLICKLADILPCRIVGDPLQGIYNFGGNQLVDWNKDVFSFFNQLPDLTIPYRWKNTPRLGERLKELRQKLLNKQSITYCAQSASYRDIIKFFYEGNNFAQDKVFVICEPINVNYPHFLCQNLSNRFRTIEPLTSKDLCEYAAGIDSSCGINRLKNAIEFAKVCLTNISKESGEIWDFLTNKKGKRCFTDSELRLKHLFLNIVNSNNLKCVYDLFIFFEEEYKPTYKRYQLWNEMKKGLQEVVLKGSTSLEEAAWKTRNQLRFTGNRIPQRCISRTVLLKGLECDHAIIIKPELFDAKNLYVAFTRASTKITIISDKNLWSYCQ